MRAISQKLETLYIIIMVALAVMLSLDGLQASDVLITGLYIMLYYIIWVVLGNPVRARKRANTLLVVLIGTAFIWAFLAKAYMAFTLLLVVSLLLFPAIKKLHA